jgi:hypothetical protein
MGAHPDGAGHPRQMISTFAVPRYAASGGRTYWHPMRMTSLPGYVRIRSLRPSALTVASLRGRLPRQPGVLAVGVSRFPDLGRGGIDFPDLGRGGIDVEVGVLAKPVLAQPVLSACAEHAETVSDAPAQVDR